MRDSWATVQTSLLRITSTRGCEYDSAYSVELLALTAAIPLSPATTPSVLKISVEQFESPIYEIPYVSYSKPGMLRRFLLVKVLIGFY